MISDLLKETLLVVALLTVIPLGCGTVTGLFVAVLQAATQVQEQCSAFLVKLLTVSLAIFLTAQFTWPKLIALMDRALACLEYQQGVRW